MLSALRRKRKKRGGLKTVINWKGKSRQVNENVGFMRWVGREGSKPTEDKAFRGATFRRRENVGQKMAEKRKRKVSLVGVSEKR